MKKLFGARPPKDLRESYSLESGGGLALEPEQEFHTLEEVEEAEGGREAVPRGHALTVRHRRGPTDPRALKPASHSLGAPAPESLLISKEATRSPLLAANWTGASGRGHFSPSKERPVEAPGHAAPATHVERLAADYDEGVLEFARALGIDEAGEPHLLYIAEEAYFAPLPAPWAEMEDAAGRIYFYNEETDVSQWEHPLDKHYRAMVFQIKEEQREQRERALRPRAASLPPLLRLGRPPRPLRQDRPALPVALAEWQRLAPGAARGEGSPLPAGGEEGWSEGPGRGGAVSPLAVAGVRDLVIDARAKGRDLDTTRLLPSLSRTPSASPAPAPSPR
eukprot:tig00020780_g13807.t1